MHPMRDKVCLVTGANRGLGLETARGLWSLGARVILHARDKDQAKAAAQNIAGESMPRVSVALADFADLAAVAAMGEKLASRHPKIDVVVHNAGYYPQRYEKTRDGFEKSMAVNHLAPFVLNAKLLESVKAADRSRIVVTSSSAHTRVRQWGDLFLGPNDWAPMKAYAKSKFANVVFAFELARRLEGSGVAVNAVHPGLVATGMANDLFGAVFKARWIAPLVKPFILTAAKGAQSAIHVASSGAVDGVTGRYFVNSKLKWSTKYSQKPKVWERVWEQTEQALKQGIQV